MNGWGKERPPRKGGGALRTLFDLPPRVYQRHSPFWDRLVLAAGWAGLYWLCSGIEPWVGAYGAATAALPPQLPAVVTALILVAGLFSPLAAYLILIVGVAYPLYLISIYVMALAVAVLVLIAPLLVARADRGAWPLALLVLSAPVLAPFHLTPALSLLAGLWWGRTSGAVAGGLAALWLKICAGMSGTWPDLWDLNGWRMPFGPLYERFHAANSLQTVLRLVQPLVGRLGSGLGIEPVLPGTLPIQPGMAVLFHVLQVLSWAAAGYVVGALLDLIRMRRVTFDGDGAVPGGGAAALSLGPGIVLIWAGYAAVPCWLRLGEVWWFDPPWLPAQVLWAAGVAWCLDGLLRYVRRPVLPARWAEWSARPEEAHGLRNAETRRQRRKPGAGAAVGRLFAALGPRSEEKPGPIDARGAGGAPRAKRARSRGTREEKDEALDPREPLAWLKQSGGSRAERPAQDGQASDIMIELD